MSIALALTWVPRGETGRFVRLYPQIAELYDQIVIAAAPNTKPEDTDPVTALGHVRLLHRDEWASGRHLALRMALETGADYIHYCDADRLIRWIELYPDELRATVAAIQTTDCLVIGRSEYAFGTHPRALQDTERLCNAVFSHLLGQTLDFSAGSKGFSRRAVEFLLRNTEPTRAMGTDSEWMILLHRAGFTLTPHFVDGLDWESADQFRDTAADAETQRQVADAYDAQAKSWVFRVGVAQEIIDTGLEALTRPLNQESPA